jgi:hypothetical protein
MNEHFGRCEFPSDHMVIQGLKPAPRTSRIPQKQEVHMAARGPFMQICVPCGFSDKTRRDHGCLLRLMHLRDGKDPKDFKCPYTSGQSSVTLHV